VRDTPADERTVHVYAGWGEGKPRIIGRLYSSLIRGKGLTAFEHDGEWLRSSCSGITLDPELRLREGRQYADGKPMFGFISDSCPDRWGRLLMNRREAVQARDDGRKPRALTEADYLLGVYDEARMGALRFALEEGGAFLSADESLCAPPWTTVRALEAASSAFERDESGLDRRWLSQLIAPGSSLGGARPKASVMAPDGSLWIAKFPSKHDEWDTGAWEMVAHELAAECGLDVPEAKLEAYSGNGGTYLAKRFDRDGGSRIHFASAMTMLGMADGNADGAGYLDIAAFIKADGASPSRDLRELWRRIVFSMAVSNTDDHLRNHGFLLTKAGWALSPMYDVNPNIYGDSLSLNVSRHDGTMEPDIAVGTARHYGIGEAEAKVMAEEIRGTVGSRWRMIATEHGLGRDAIRRMEPAFG